MPSGRSRSGIAHVRGRGSRGLDQLIRAIRIVATISASDLLAPNWSGGTRALAGAVMRAGGHVRQVANGVLVE